AEQDVDVVAPPGRVELLAKAVLLACRFPLPGQFERSHQQATAEEGERSGEQVLVVDVDRRVEVPEAEQQHGNEGEPAGWSLHGAYFVDGVTDGVPFLARA